MTFTRKQLLLLATAVVVVAGAAIAYPWIYGSRPGDPDVTGEIAVTIRPATVTTLRETVSVAGTVVPQTAADLTVSASEPCAVAELPKQEGEAVQAGDIVVRLDIPSVAAELATRQLELSDASQKYETAKAEATRLGSLYDRGLAARNQAETARAAMLAAEVTLNQARGRVETAKAAENATIIRARFPGVVVKRWKNVGDLVNGLDTDPILRIVDMNRLQISAPIAATEATRVLPGQIADVQTDSGPTSAVVALKLAGPSAAATITDVRLNFVAPTTLPLDTPVQVSIVVNERRDVLVVPAEAIQRVDTQTFVWLANDNNQATRREIRIGYISKSQAEVVAGLTAGEAVIVTGIAELTEGTRIVIGR